MSVVWRKIHKVWKKKAGSEIPLSCLQEKFRHQKAAVKVY